METGRAERQSTGNRELDAGGKRLFTLARALFALSIVFAVYGSWYALSSGQIQSEIGEGLELLDTFFFGIVMMVYGIVGLVILSRHPRHVIGWLLLTVGFVLGWGQIMVVIFDWGVAALDSGLNPVVGVLIAFSNQSWLFFLVIPMVFLPLYFPSGKLISKRYRFFVIGTLTGLLLLMLGGAISPILDFDTGEPNPFGIEGAQPLGDTLNIIGPLLVILGIFGGVYSFYSRYRHASSVERAQIKTLVFIVVPFLLFIILSSVLDEGLRETLRFDILSTLLFMVYLFLIPVSIGFAILRHNMWNIDVVINRTAVYGAMTLLLFGLFGGSLFAITTLFSDFANGPLIAGIVAAGVFGAGFQPMHRSLQRFVDQRFYNIQIDYQRTPTALQHFSPDQTDTQFGAYHGLELIGRGGMAEVYRAFGEDSNEPVAIKILPRDLAQDPEYRKRFEREVQVMLSLEHPNIVNVSKYGEEQHLPFIVMEFIRGRDLANHLAQVGRVSPHQSASILSGTASALDYAHGKGLIHRDIKPSNVMLDQEADTLRPVLMDFGVAKILGRSMLTHSGFLGTLDYISPEQIQGEEDINHRADIYSLGIVAFQMLTGELPFKAKNPGAILLAHLTQPPPNILDLQPKLSKQTGKAIIKALSKSPSDRFPSATEFVSALNLSADG